MSDRRRLLCSVCGSGTWLVNGTCRDCKTPRPLFAGDAVAVSGPARCPRCGQDMMYIAYGLCLECYYTQERTTDA